MVAEETQGSEEHCKADGGETNWINRETKRIETEVEKLVEMQENVKTRKEALRVAYGEIIKLRTDLAHKSESMDTNKSHVLSSERLEQVRNLELQEPYLRRAAASKRMAGAMRDATTEVIASWSVEASGTNCESDLW